MPTAHSTLFFRESLWLLRRALQRMHCAVQSLDQNILHLLWQSERL
jgi:hypothetical protein